MTTNHELNRNPERTQEPERIEELLKDALPRIDGDAEPSRDLWPDLLKRMDSEPVRVPWFDWALATGLFALIAVFPGAIPVFLYYL